MRKEMILNAKEDVRVTYLHRKAALVSYRAVFLTDLTWLRISGGADRHCSDYQPFLNRCGCRTPVQSKTDCKHVQKLSGCLVWQRALRVVPAIAKTHGFQRSPRRLSRGHCAALEVSVFNKLQDHNEIHRDELSKGLELLGERLGVSAVMSIGDTHTLHPSTGHQSRHLFVQPSRKQADRIIASCYY